MDRPEEDIAVIIPVYKNTKLTIECINSCLPGVKEKNSHIIIINDASPEPTMQENLQELAHKHSLYITLISNDDNLGFVKSINRGLKLTANSDVVLLNNDVIVPDSWLQTFRKDMKYCSRIGTITPLSNNSTITSIPIRNKGSEIFLKHDINALNDCLHDHLPLVCAPTGVGFCMYITRTCLEAVGSFNEEAFGLGYGEENDFCQRALKKGFINLISPNLYCHHVGSVSFGSSAPKKIQNGVRVVSKLHPNYLADVQTWIHRDPLKVQRIIRSYQLFKSSNTPVILFITHDFGGGTQEHVISLIHKLGLNIYPLLLKGRRGHTDNCKMQFGWKVGDTIDEIIFGQDEDLISALNYFQPDLIHIHHFAGIPNSVYHWVVNSKPIPIITTFHDFYFVKGNPTLTKKDGEYQGIEACSSDHLLNLRTPQPFSQNEWASKSSALIASCILNIFPSVDTMRRYQQAFGKIKNAVVVPHEELCKARNINSTQISPIEIKLVAIGALSKEKGADFLNKLAAYTRKNIKDVNFKWSLIGYCYKKIHGVRQTGPYKQEELDILVSRSSADAIFFSARWPETYSYTLSAAIRSGLPIIAPDIGAFPERLRDYEKSLLYSINEPIQTVVSNIIEFIKLSSNQQKAAMVVNSYYTDIYLDLARSRHLQYLEGTADIFKILSRNSEPYNSSIRGRLLTFLLQLYEYFMVLPISKLVFFRNKRRIK